MLDRLGALAPGRYLIVIQCSPGLSESDWHAANEPLAIRECPDEPLGPET
eukprot:SAG22_NODE_16441_length_325_cov_0.818584_1_plen_49_part_01